MAIADRVCVLRHGKKTGEVLIKNTDRDSLAKMMMGAESKSPQVLPSEPGPALSRVERCCYTKCWQRARFEVSRPRSKSPARLSG